MQSKNKFIFLLSITFIAIPTFVASHATNPPTDTFHEIKNIIEGVVSEITTEDDLHAALTSSKPTVILGYMDPCPHCSSIKPHMKALAKKYPKISFATANGPRLVMHKKVSALSNSSIKIPGYPTTIFINNGQIVDHVIGGNKQKLDQKTLELAAASKESRKKS